MCSSSYNCDINNDGSRCDSFNEDVFKNKDDFNNEDGSGSNANKNNDGSSNGNHYSYTAHTLDELKKMTVKEIRDLLKQEDLKVSGKKAELIERLLHRKNNDFKIQRSRAHFCGTRRIVSRQTGEKSLREQYLPRRMEEMKKNKYTKETTFEDAMLLKLTPDDIARWMKTKCYGKEDPGPDDDPTLVQASSLMYYKKTLSFFIPDRLETWSVRRGEGNPTKSIPVNDLVKSVKTMYSYRKVIWDKIDEIVCRGHSASAVVDLIEKAYNFQPVINIIKTYRRDRKEGRVPSQLNPSPNFQ